MASSASSKSRGETETPLILADESEHLRISQGDELPMVRFVSIICVDRNVPAHELMKWDVELQMIRQSSSALPNCVIYGANSDEPWVHGLKPQLLPCQDYNSPLQWTDLNEVGRFVWADILLPEEFCEYDGHLVLRYKNGNENENNTTSSTSNSNGAAGASDNNTSKASEICPPRLTITNYMTYEHKGYKCGTPPTRALVVDIARSGEPNSLGVYTIHLCDLLFDGEEILFPESYQQALYHSVRIGRSDTPATEARTPEEVIAAEMQSYCVATGRMIMDPVVAFHQVTPAGYIENANTAGRPIHTETLDILMTQRARNKIIELRNRFKHVSSRQRYLHFTPRDIFPLMLCQRDEVAVLLKVSTTWLKDRIRAFGVNEWPARALMVHSSELRLALLTLRLLLGGQNGVRARVAAGVPITSDVVDTVKRLHTTIHKLRHERFAVLKDYLTPNFYEMFTENAAIWCLDPNWDKQPPWEYTHSDHSLGYGFGRLSVVRNYPAQEKNEDKQKGMIDESGVGEPC